MDWEIIRTWTIAGLMLLGCLMSLGAAVGLLRFGDVLSRMHAGTKPQVLGLLCLLAAAGLASGQWALVPLLALIWLIQLLTAPVSAHMVGRAAYRSKHLKEDSLVEDDLAEVVRAAEARQSGNAANHGDTRAASDRGPGFVEGAPQAVSQRIATAQSDGVQRDPGHRDSALQDPGVEDHQARHEAQGPDPS